MYKTPRFLLALIAALLSSAMTTPQSAQAEANTQGEAKSPNEKTGLRVHYLEIVTPSVDETCAMLEQVHGVTFGEPVAELGNARTAELRGGGRIGVRAPLRETEAPVVRPYVLTDDIEAAVKAAVEAGATVAMPPMAIPGQGRFSIYILGGIEHGLWQR